MQRKQVVTGDKLWDQTYGRLQVAYTFYFEWNSHLFFRTGTLVPPLRDLENNIF